MNEAASFRQRYDARKGQLLGQGKSGENAWRCTWFKLGFASGASLVPD